MSFGSYVPPPSKSVRANAKRPHGRGNRWNGAAVLRAVAFSEGSGRAAAASLDTAGVTQPAQPLSKTADRHNSTEQQLREVTVLAGRLELRPLSIAGARREVRRLHRHLPKVVGGLFASSVYVGEELAGVGIASEPKAPASRGKRIVEITRVATDGHKNACSKLYGALCRAAGALGYQWAITFTRVSEPGSSLRAAGFVDMGLTREQSWNRPSRKRDGELSQVRRWMREVTP